MPELISKKTRLEFREFLVGWTLREIEMEFDSADVDCDAQYDPQVGGQRRTLVEQYYHSVDFTVPSDVRKILSAYENVLNSAIQRQLPISGLVACLRRDGYQYYDGRISPHTPETKPLFDKIQEEDISESTRRNIIDELRINNVRWWGKLSEGEFLSRVFDLYALPSHDNRYTNAASDISQHRERNNDWSDDWVFSDHRFNLMHCPDEVFLRFLCEMVHPVAREEEDANVLVSIFNQHLAASGYEVIPIARISGKQIFAAKRRALDYVPALQAGKSLAQTLDADYISQQFTRMNASIDKDPELAIGTAKEFLETICKTILRDCGDTAVYNKLDLPQLVKKVRQELQILPEDVPHHAKGAETVKRILSSLGNISQGLAEFRSLYGSGHGKDAKTIGLQPRHARLAVNSASTLAVFLYETYVERKGSEGK